MSESASFSIIRWRKGLCGKFFIEVIFSFLKGESQAYFSFFQGGYRMRTAFQRAMKTNPSNPIVHFLCTRQGRTREK
ncbi:MAG: hypothetical protein M0Z48_08620, partial [Nitrospiraceae bacterium]|nr:hypothetical protein [Nitrospiraceae bacterium]